MKITKTTEEIQFKINELNKSELEKDEALNIFYEWIADDSDEFDECTPLVTRR